MPIWTHCQFTEISISWFEHPAQADHRECASQSNKLLTTENKSDLQWGSLTYPPIDEDGGVWHNVIVQGDVLDK